MYGGTSITSEFTMSIYIFEIIYIDHIIQDIKILKDKSGEKDALMQFVLTLDTTNLHQNFVVDNLESAKNLEPMASQLSHQSNLVCDV